MESRWRCRDGTLVLVQYLMVTVIGSMIGVDGRSIAEYDSGSYQDIIQNRDDNNIESDLQTAYQKDLERKVKRSDEGVDPLDDVSKQLAGDLDMPSLSDAVIIDENNMSNLYDGLDDLKEFEDAGAVAADEEPFFQTMEERQKKQCKTEEKKEPACCNDMNYVKTFPPCCGTTCCKCQETCPARGVASPLPGTCSM